MGYNGLFEEIVLEKDMEKHKFFSNPQALNIDLRD